MKGFQHSKAVSPRLRITFPPKESFVQPVDARLLSRLLQLLRPSAGLVSIAVLLLILFSVTSLVGPYLTHIAIDDHIAAKDGTGLTRICLLWFAFLALSGGLHYVQLILTNTIGQRAMKSLREEIYAHLQKLPVSFFDRNAAGRLMTRVTNDVEVLSGLFTEGVVSIFGDVFALFVIIGVLVSMNPELALVAFAAVPLLAVASILFKRLARSAFREVRHAVSNINVYLLESLTGISAAKSFARERLGEEEFNELNTAHLHAVFKAIRTFSIYFPVVDLIQSLAIAAILWYGGGQVVQDVLTFGALVAFIQYSGRFFRPIRDLADKYNVLQDSLTAAERVFSLLDEPVPKEPANSVSLQPEAPITYRDVTASYDGEVNVLKGVSFQIAPGTTTAIVGATGAGKTTLVNLLLRFYDPVDGTISIGETSISNIPTHRLRSATALVEQDVFLFSGTVEDNITLFDPTIPSRTLDAAIGASRAGEFIDRLPEGAQTVLSERGTSLSSGERQLLAFARALASDPKILILDEATAAVDSETEARIQEALKSLLKNRTAIVIAHRLSTIRSADQIIVLSRGRVAEKGTHETLIAQKGLYERLYRFQFEQQSDRWGEKER